MAKPKRKSAVDVAVIELLVVESKLISDGIVLRPRSGGELVSVPYLLKKHGLKPGEKVVLLREKDFEAMQDLAWRYEEVSK